MNGFINLNKPTGRTSSDLVVFVRKRLPRGTAVGHGGTLDPEASGVLPVCVGSATRLFDYIIDKQKTYVARIRLGVETDTQDATGRVVSEKPVTVGEDELRAVLSEFTGEIEQVPPMYSALKKDGQKLCDLARKGIEVERKSRRVTVYELALTDANEEKQEFSLAISCSAGTYIRSLVADVGAALGCGAVLTALRRTYACGYTLADCVTLDELKARCEAGTAGEIIRPTESLFADYEALTVSEAQSKRFQNGAALDIARTAWRKKDVENRTLVRVKDPSGKLVCEYDDELW